MRNEDFIKQRLIDESQNLLDAEFYFPVFLIISQGIETLGGFLDKKPLGAKSQSKKRFHLAINQLFENKYKELTDRDWLYKQFRCNMSHLATTGGFIILTTKKDNKGAHLEVIQGQRLFVIESLVEDFHKACHTLILRLVKGDLKQKQMFMNEISSYNL
tara:strand:- start:169 stop:645 length:477 start_codon:yes stop_codon:yes gene_type:complete